MRGTSAEDGSDNLGLWEKGKPPMEETMRRADALTGKYGTDSNEQEVKDKRFWR